MPDAPKPPSEPPEPQKEPAPPKSESSDPSDDGLLCTFCGLKACWTK